MNLKNVCLFEGRIIADPQESKSSTEEHRKATLKIAVDRGMSSKAKKEAEEKGQPTADFVSFFVNGKTAENVLEYYKKGHSVDVAAHYATWTSKDSSGDTIYHDGFIVDQISWTTQSSAEHNGNGNAGTAKKAADNKNKKNPPKKTEDDDYYGSPDDEYVPF